MGFLLLLEILQNQIKIMKLKKHMKVIVRYCNNKKISENNEYKENNNELKNSLKFVIKTMRVEFPKVEILLNLKKNMNV